MLIELHSRKMDLCSERSRHKILYSRSHEV